MTRQSAKIKPPANDGKNGKGNVSICLTATVAGGKGFDGLERAPCLKKQKVKKDNEKMSESNKELNRTANGTDENKSPGVNRSDLLNGKAADIRRKYLPSAPPKRCSEKQTAKKRKKKTAEVKRSDKCETPMTTISAMSTGKSIQDPALHQ